MPDNTLKNPATGRISKKKLDFSGKIISVYEVGGQVPYLEESFSQFRESVYSDVKNLIFVVDASVRKNFMKALYYYNQACSLTLEYNKNAKIAIFAHKIDLVPEDKKLEILNEIRGVFNVGYVFNSVMFPTSIYDENFADLFLEIGM